MKGKSLYLPFGHAFEGVDSENELQTTTKIHFEYESCCGRHLAKMRRRAPLTSGKSMVRQIVLFTWRKYGISTNSTWRSSWWKNFHCTCCTCKSTAKEKILNMSTKTYWISKCVVLFSARFCPWKSKHIHQFIMEASNLEESDLKGMEVCSFGGTEMALPIDLIEQVNHGLARNNAKLSRFM